MLAPAFLGIGKGDHNLQDARLKEDASLQMLLAYFAEYISSLDNYNISIILFVCDQ